MHKDTLKNYLRNNVCKMQCDVWFKKCQRDGEEVALKAGVRDEAKKVPLSQIKKGLVCYAKGMDFSLQTLGSQWRCLTEELDKADFQGMGLRGTEGLLE